jgi:LacI family transcriptional regulator
MSIQSLAHSLGLSTSTVSRALNGYADVSAKTRSRIEHAAKAMNYRPHPVAHRLATGRTGAIALVSSVRAGNYLDATFAALLSGAAEVMRAQGYFALSVGLPTGEGEIPELERFLAGHLVDGVILARTRIDDPRVRLLQARGIAFVTHGRTEANAAHAWVDPDNEQAFYLATQRLVALGHRRIALINGQPHMTYAVLRERGFRSALDHAGIPSAAAAVVYGEVTAADGERLAQEVFAHSSAPTAIVCATDAQALGAMAACKARGLRVGVDVSVSGYGNTEAGAYSDPPLATIEHAVMANGQHLAQLLMRRMAGEPPEALTQLEPVQMIERASIGPAPVPVP